MSGGANQYWGRLSLGSGYGGERDRATGATGAFSHDDRKCGEPGLSRSLRSRRACESSHSLRDRRGRQATQVYLHVQAVAMLLDKIDLLPHLTLDVVRCLQHARTVNPNLEIFCVSAISGDGMQEWYGWFRKQFQIVGKASVC